METFTVLTLSELTNVVSERGKLKTTGVLQEKMVHRRRYFEYMEQTP